MTLFFIFTKNLVMYREISVESETGTLSISSADVKSYLKIDYSDDDTLILNMITSARVYLENYLSRDLVGKSRKYYIPLSETGKFDIPFSPINSIIYVQVDGVNLATGSYEVNGIKDKSIDLKQTNAKNVIVRYNTKSIAEQEDIQINAIHNAIKIIVADLYENRSNYVIGQAINSIPIGAKNLVAGFKSMYV